MSEQAFAFIRVPTTALGCIEATLRLNGFSGAAVDVTEAAKEYLQPDLVAERERLIKVARAEMSDTDIAFDSDAALSHADGGVWVMGWFFLPERGHYAAEASGS
jgi:hypothetical protein